jgi:hypothetical protein
MSLGRRNRMKSTNLLERRYSVAATSRIIIYCGAVVLEDARKYFVLNTIRRNLLKVGIRLSLYSILAEFNKRPPFILVFWAALVFLSLFWGFYRPWYFTPFV